MAFTVFSWLNVDAQRTLQIVFNTVSYHSLATIASDQRRVLPTYTTTDTVSFHLIRLARHFFSLCETSRKALAGTVPNRNRMYVVREIRDNLNHWQNINSIRPDLNQCY